MKWSIWYALLDRILNNGTWLNGRGNELRHVCRTLISSFNAIFTVDAIGLIGATNIVCSTGMQCWPGNGVCKVVRQLDGGHCAITPLLTLNFCKKMNRCF